MFFSLPKNVNVNTDNSINKPTNNNEIIKGKSINPVMGDMIKIYKVRIKSSS